MILATVYEINFIFRTIYLNLIVNFNSRNVAYVF